MKANLFTATPTKQFNNTEPQKKDEPEVDEDELIRGLNKTVAFMKEVLEAKILSDVSLINCLLTLMHT